MSDLISRQGLMKEFAEFVKRSNNSDFAPTPTWNDAVSLVGSMPSAQPEKRTEERAETHACDLIDRQAAIEAIRASTSKYTGFMEMEMYTDDDAVEAIESLPSAQPEVIRCKDCIYYDPPHVENNGMRYEYDEMPADAFDALGTGLVNAEYGINIGGRCCVDYYCKNYSDDKRVFVREDNYCGRAERRTDGSD